MPATPTQHLSSKLKTEREAMQRDALGVIDALGSIAATHGLEGTAAEFTRISASLKSGTFSMIVMGRFKNGKSTLINALMGGTTRPVDLGGALGPMVVDDLPATAVLSKVSYADTPFIKAVDTDETVQQWTLAQYLRDSRIGSDTEENRLRFAKIKQFEVGFPARLCESNVILYDSPGLDENPIRTVVTMEAVRDCDAALMVFTTNALGGENELKDDAKVRNDGTRVFVVVNVFNNRPVDDRLRGYVWNKYVHEHLNGPEWAGQDLAEQNIFFVNAKLAADSRYALTGAAADQAYLDSGLAALEERLARFLIHERFASSIATFSTRAISASDEILEYFREQQATGAVKRESFRKAWEQEQVRLEKLRGWPKELRLPRIIDSYRNEAILGLTSGVTRLITQIRRDLPGHLEEVTLPTQGSATFASLHQKQLAEEALAEINSFISGRVTDWSENQANTLLKGVADKLSEHVNDEVAELASRFNWINMALTGVDNAASGTQGNARNTAERVRESVEGILFGDFNPQVAGGGAGARSFLGGLAGGGAVGWVLVGVLGITSALVLAPMAAAAALLGVAAGSTGLVAKIKNKAIEAADKQLALLPNEVPTLIEKGIRARFAELETTVTADVTAYVDGQVRSIEAMNELKLQSQQEQERILQGITTAEHDVRRLRKALENTLTAAQQQRRALDWPTL